MSGNQPAPMSGHFFWSDGTETHIANLFTDIDTVPTNKGFLILVARYIDPTTLQEYEPKIGHWIAGHDNYYVSITGAGPNNIEYAMWDNPVTGNTRVTVYQLIGQNVETKRENVKVNSLPSTRQYVGALVSDQQWNATVERSKLF